MSRESDLTYDAVYDWLTVHCYTTGKFYGEKRERKNNMEEKKQRVILEGNAFYEIDLECMRQKQKKKDTQTERRGYWEIDSSEQREE